MNITTKDLLQVKHLSSELTTTTKFSNVSTDSRTVKKGDLFIALRGENFDGHDFIAQVAKQGAKAAIVDAKWFRKIPRRPKLNYLVVKDTTEAMGELARLYRRKLEIPILAIGGANGKTTTKELVAHVLGTSFNVLKTEANFNNKVGVPQMLFRLTNKHQIAVLEIGTNHPGEVAWLTNVIEPTHTLITNIGREHLEFFKNLDGVAKEETSAFFITEAMNGFGFINHDDQYLKPFSKLFGEWSISYGTKGKADVVGKSKGYDAKGKHIIELSYGKKKFIAKTNLLAKYAANLCASVTAVALHFNISQAKIKKALESYQPHSKRMQIEKLKSGVTIINDAYNANPESFIAALDTLKGIPSKGRKFIVAGDMFELGATAKREHTALGKAMKKYKLRGYLFTGKDMKLAHKALGSRNGFHFNTKDEIATVLRSVLQKGDIVLVKGSRGMKMEEVIEKLRISS